MYQNTPIEMNDPRSPIISKTKLVTILSTASENDAFATLFPMFVFTGNSRKQKTGVEVSFPSYLGNFMFYEHYRESKFDSPYRLSFMYLGRNAKGELSYNFRDYKTVEIVEFSHQLQSVNLVFQVINQLPKCKEVRFYLDDENHLVSAEDDESFYRYKHFPCNSNTVKVLKIVRISNSNDQTWRDRTRFPEILKYALELLPNLEHLYVEGMDGKGAAYDLAEAFWRTKSLPRHKTTIRKDGRTFCEPEDQPTSRSRNAITQGVTNVPLNVMVPPSSGCSTVRNQPTLPPVKPETTMHKREVEPEPEPDVEIVTAPAVPSPDIIDIASDDETGASPPKKPKTESIREIVESRRVDAASPASTSSLSSMATCVITNPPLPVQSSSLTSISSAYNEWENSSDDEREALQNPPNPKRKSTDPPSVVKNEISQSSNNVLNDELVITPNVAARVSVPTEVLQNILDVVHGVPSDPRAVTENVRRHAKPRKKGSMRSFSEGVHFERRPRP